MPTRFLRASRRQGEPRIGEVEGGEESEMEEKESLVSSKVEIDRASDTTDSGTDDRALRAALWSFSGGGGRGGGRE